MSSSPVTVCVDAMGGDLAPAQILAGIDRALEADPGLTVLATGPEDVVRPFAELHPTRVQPVLADEVIGMNEHPVQAVRSKTRSTIVVGCKLVKDGFADAFFSAGSTGAVMAGATLLMGRMQGVSRPAIATVLPTSGIPVVLIDAGANADCKAENLLQFAAMGAAYASVVLGRSAPTVALLNIGLEPAKGSQLALDAHRLMQTTIPGFVGNIEPQHVLDGEVDVIVTDGFTGNVVLKLLEGTSRTLLTQVKEAMTSSIITTVAGAVLRPALLRLRERLDPEAYGGAPLLGLTGVCIIGHGSSSARAVENALGVAAQAARGRLIERIRSTLAT